eukprot:gene1882-1914_t
MRNWSSAGRGIWRSRRRCAVALVRERAPSPVVVLASGDPFCFGVGPMLADALPQGSWRCLPQPSCLSLACARLGWAQQDCEVISFCGRPLAKLRGLLQPGQRVLALSEDGTTPGQVAELLAASGFGASEMVVLEALGGSRERVTRHRASGFDAGIIDRLNMMAITMRADPGVRVLAKLPGLPDDAFEHDGQITKREVRAATLAALAPMPGELLWDIGTGSGSIAIEWLRAHRSNQVIAIDRRADRLVRARANALALGVDALRWIEGSAAEVIGSLPAPDAIFIGGGAQSPGLVSRCWEALRPGGRLVVNAVTIETEAVLAQAQAALGGSLTRLGIAHLVEVGGMHGYRPAMVVTQFCVAKP